MSHLLPTKYRVKIALYRTKSFLRGAFSTSRGGIKKRARLFSVLAVFVVAGLIFSFSVYGFNLKGGAQGTKISSTDIFDKIVYFDVTNNKWVDLDKSPVPGSNPASAVTAFPDSDPCLKWKPGHRALLSLTPSAIS